MFREFVDSREGFSEDEQAAYEAEYNAWLESLEEDKESVRLEEDKIGGIYRWF